MKAFLKNYSQSPRKVRLVANLVRGKSVEKALEILSFMDKKSAPAIKKLLQSAIANAENANKNASELFVQDIRVDSGIAFRRMMPRAMGRGTPFRRRKSRVSVTLGERKVTK